MSPSIPSPFTRRISERRKELEALQAYPEEKLVSVIEEVGFSCTLCGKCCTRDFNGHVLLLDDDAARMLSRDPACLEPPPVYDLCDQHGTFYVSGYTIRAGNDRAGTCQFLERGRCRVYADRPWVCRVYPYMLHREPDETGEVDWRQISGLDQHGEYHSQIPPEKARDIARDVKAFETAVLCQEIAFLEYIGEYFARHDLRHVRKRFDDRLREHQAGADITVKVFFQDSLEPWLVGGHHTERMPGTKGQGSSGDR
ncbi:MAG: YkgJ family cysteine cluster protein [Methanolinea sp.]